MMTPSESPVGADRDGRRRKLLRLVGLGVPCAAMCLLLSTDVFDLRDMVFGAARRQVLSHAVHGAVAPESAVDAAEAKRKARSALATSEGMPLSCRAMDVGYEMLLVAGATCSSGAELPTADVCNGAAEALGLNARWDVGDESGDHAGRGCHVRPDAAADDAPLRPICRKLVQLPTLESAVEDTDAKVRARIKERWRAWSEGHDAPLPASGAAVGASIAVHPPKFYAVALFLREWAACPAAMASLRIFLVFSDSRDHELFIRAQECLNPDMPHELWTPVVVPEPHGGWATGGVASQTIAAYKKWQGAAHMMDLHDAGAGLEYGLLLDAELAMFHLHGAGPGGGDAAAACGKGGAWSRLLERIKRMESGKAFPAARVSDNLTSYPFGKSIVTGKSYDTGILDEIAAFTFVGRQRPGSEAECDSDGCKEIVRQVKECLFSWWTDLPWVRLETAKGMLSRHSEGRNATPEGGWQKLAAGIRFPRFEHVAYQQHCVLHEGFRFRDVTSLTLEAKWGSYLEDAQPGARLDELTPMWVSSETATSALRGAVQLSKSEPPLLLFHVDHGQSHMVPGMFAEKGLWETHLLDLLDALGREGEFTKDSIKL